MSVRVPLRLIALAALAGCPRPTPDPEVPEIDPVDTGTPGSAPTGPVETGEVEYELRLDDTVPPPLTLALSKDEVADLLGPVAEDIVLLELDSGPLLTDALERIKTACGTAWQRDDADPRHDCDLTPLGQSFVGPDGTWRSSAEYALVRLLTMTPANSDVEDTSIAGLQEVADLLDIGGGFGQILSDSLEIGRTEEFLDTETVVAALQADLLATHPALAGRTAIPITLADALADLAPLGVRLGPSGAHPGILDPAFPPSSRVLTDDFVMSLSMQSNLRVLDGVDLSTGKDYLAVIDDRTGPDTGDVAEFDFEDPAKFSMSGIAPHPLADLRFAFGEHPTWVPSCVDDPGCLGNLPGAPSSAASVWATDPWTLEHVIATAGRNAYQNLVHDQDYTVLFVLWVATVSIGQDGNPPGWTNFSVVLDIGDPPGDQYVWELLTEVAQRNLHTNETYDFPEGAANVAFSITDVDVGMTATEIEDAVRPVLQAQADDIATYLLGDFRKNSGAVDFTWRRLADGTPALVFTSPDDLDPDADYPYTAPGFWADPALAQKLSTAQDGHEVWVPPRGESTVHVRDAEGGIWQLRVFRETAAAEVVSILALQVGA